MIRKLKAIFAPGATGLPQAQTRAGWVQLTSLGLAVENQGVVGTQKVYYDVDDQGNLVYDSGSGPQTEMELMVPETAGLFFRYTIEEPDGFIGSYFIEGGTTADIQLRDLKAKGVQQPA